MNFGKFAQDALNKVTQQGGSDNSDKPANDAGNNNQTGGSGSGWSEVGREAKQTFDDFEQGRSKGQAPDYAKAGEVAKKAYATYGSSDGPKDPESIGKAIFAGFRGGDSNSAKPSAPAGNDAKPESAPPTGNADRRNDDGNRNDGNNNDDVLGGDNKSYGDNNNNFGERRQNDEPQQQGGRQGLGLGRTEDADFSSGNFAGSQQSNNRGNNRD